jgi:tetratricopeptide (TPR) repeat protein
MRFLTVKAWAVAFLTSILMLGAHLGAARAGQPWLEKLSEPDRQEFTRLVGTVDGWTADKADKIKAELQAFVSAHPDFVPARVEATRAQWLNVASRMGFALSSKSFFIVFEELERLDPSYPPAYVYGARTYIYSGYPAGARNQLEKAQALDAANPWVDLTWSLMFEHLDHRKDALVWAKTALPKTAGNTKAMVGAILAITNLQGVTNHDDAVALADHVIALEPDMDKLAGVIHGCLSNYTYQPRLLEVVTEIIQKVQARQPASNALLHEIARLDLNLGYMYNDGAMPRYRPEYAAAATVILDKIGNDPQLAEKLWDTRFNLALSRGDFAAMTQLLDEAGAKGYDVTLIGYREAQLLMAQGKYSDVMALYQRRNLPEDDLLAMAYDRGGDYTVADRIYLRDLEANPTSGLRNAVYADLRLFRFRDIDGAIKYGEKAYALYPSGWSRSLVTIAWLVKSSDYIKTNKSTEAKEAFARARRIGIDPESLQALCSNLCNDVNLSLSEFR